MSPKNERLINLDLLKVVSMVMIIALHYFGKGGILHVVKPSNRSYYFVIFTELLCFTAVNCYVLCSGYLMKDNRFKASKLVNIYIITWFLNFAGFILSLSMDWNTASAEIMGKALFPISFDAYWYVNAYFVFYLFSPLLIFIVKNVSLSKLRMIVVLSVIVFSVSFFDWAKVMKGYHFVWFCVLFFVASYIREADLLKGKSSKYFLLFVVFAAANFGLKFLVEVFMGVIAGDLFSYNNIFVFLSSVMLFAAFKNLEVKHFRKAIAFLSSLTLGIYLIHLNPFCDDWLFKKVVNSKMFLDSPWLIPHFVLCVVVIFAVSGIIEYGRQQLFRLLHISALAEKAGNRITLAFNNLCSKF